LSHETGERSSQGKTEEAFDNSPFHRNPSLPDAFYALKEARESKLSLNFTKAEDGRLTRRLVIGKSQAIF